MNTRSAGSCWTLQLIFDSALMNVTVSGMCCWWNEFVCPKKMFLFVAISVEIHDDFYKNKCTFFFSISIFNAKLEIWWRFFQKRFSFLAFSIRLTYAPKKIGIGKCVASKLKRWEHVVQVAKICLRTHIKLRMLADPKSRHLPVLSRQTLRIGERRKTKMANNTVCRHRVVDSSSSSGCVVWLKWWFKMREAKTLK